MKRCIFLLVLMLSGCGDASKQLLKTKPLDPAVAAAAAIKQYDTDNDGSISVTEATKSALDPSAGWDADGDKKISEAEIRERLARYEKVKPGMMMMSCNVVWRGKPLDGAEVVFEPEEFLGGSIEPAKGTTDFSGAATMMIPSVAEQDANLNGMRTGLYKVKITHPSLDIPAKYNAETTLTFELSPVENVVPPTFVLK
jgi:hypothetical protein